MTAKTTKERKVIHTHQSTPNPLEYIMHIEAHHAINAARHVRSWGLFAARRYCEKRGVHPRLFILARQLEAVAPFDNTQGD